MSKQALHVITFITFLSSNILANTTLYPINTNNKVTLKSSNIYIKENIQAITGSTNILGSNLSADKNIIIKSDGFQSIGGGIKKIEEYINEKH